MEKCKSCEELKSELEMKNDLLKKLLNYYTIAQSALYQNGDNWSPTWQKSQNVALAIEDKYNLKAMQESL